MSRFPRALGSILLALGSVALFRGSSCSVSLCVEDCDPCVSLCKCHKTCHHANLLDFASAHRLVVYELAAGVDAHELEHQTFAWIVGLSVPLATGRAGFDAHDLREFAEGVIGTNRELLDLAEDLGRWDCAAVDRAGELWQVAFAQRDARGEPTAGALVFVFDAAGRLVQIDRAIAAS